MAERKFKVVDPITGALVAEFDLFGEANDFRKQDRDNRVVKLPSGEFYPALTSSKE